MKKNDGPVFLQRPTQFHVDDSIGNPREMPIVISLNVPYSDYVPQVENDITSHVDQIHYTINASALSFKTQPRPESPIRLKIFLNLAINHPNCDLQLNIRHRPIQ